MSKLTNLFLCGVAVLFLGTPFAAAQEDQEAGLSDELSAVAALDEAAAESAEVDLTIPENAKPAELLAFVEGIERKFPQPKSEEEAIEMIGKITALYLEVADRVLADESATDEEKHQATELKVVAYTAKVQMGEDGAAAELDNMISSLLANAKTDEEKIQAYQIKLQSIASSAQADPSALDKVSALADEILANKDSEELQIFGLEVKAQEAFTRGRTEEGKVAALVEFLNGYIADTAVSQRAREKAQELKLASLLMVSMTDESKLADYEACFDEVLASPLSPESRKTVYQMRIQSLMAGGGQPGAPRGVSPENIEKLNAVAEKLIQEDSEELRAMGYASKAECLTQKAQEDPAQIDAVFEFADGVLAGNPDETLKSQMIGLKIHGYMLKVQQNPEAAKDMLAYVNEQIADAGDAELKSRLVSVKLQVLTMQIQSDPSCVDELEKTLNEITAEDAKGMERILTSCWGALYITKIQRIADNGGSLDDFNALFEQIKAKMAEMPILGFLVGNAKESLDLIGKNNSDDQLSARVFQEMIDLVSSSEDPLAKQVAASLQGTLDTANLKGSALAVEGIRVDNGEKFSSKEFDGKYILVDIWSARDQSYFEVLEELAALYKDFSPKGFEIVGINVDEKNDSLKRAVDVLGMNWTVLSNALSEEAGVKALPEALAPLPPGNKALIGPDGTIVLIDELPAIRAFLVEKLGEPEADNPEADNAETDTDNAPAENE